VSEARLNSWKSVAEYLGTSVRTAQRWNTDQGMPVRQLGGTRATVFAYPEELDSWLRSRTGSGTAKVAEEDRTLTELKHQSSELTLLMPAMWETLSENNLGAISRLCRRALDLDPNNAEASAGLASALIISALVGNVKSSFAYAVASEALRQALRQNPNLPAARCAAAWLMMVHERNWLGARKAFNAILSTQPANLLARAGYALLDVADGDLSAATSRLREACQEYALNGILASLHCWVRYLRSEYKEVLALAAQSRATGDSGVLITAIESLASIQMGYSDLQADRLKSRHAELPDQLLLTGILGYAYAVSDQTEGAIDSYLSLTRGEMSEVGDHAYPVALILMGMDERRRAVFWLKKANTEKSIWTFGLRSDPVFAPLKSEPQFEALLRQIGCPPAPAL
jgi:tetratricopeptide (TPR) repeat protein